MGDLAIEYRKIGLLPTCVGNERVRITSEGTVYYSRNSVECEEGQRWSDDWQAVGRIDEGRMATLESVIRASGLLDLESELVDETAEGGSREELDLTIDGAFRHFILQNADRRSFREVVSHIWGAKSMAEISARRD